MTRICIDDIKYLLDNNNETASWDYGYVAGLRYAGIIDDNEAMTLNKYIEECTSN